MWDSDAGSIFGWIRRWIWVKKLLAVLVAAFAFAVAGCGGVDSASAPVDISGLLLTPGDTVTGSTDIAGTTVSYAVTTPEGFTRGDTAPVLLAFPPGAQELAGTLNTVEMVYEREALRLGWVVVSPVAPNGRLFHDGSEDLMPGFVNWIEAWVTPEGGAPHVAGMSNGGRSSFRYAAQNPDRLLSLIVFPGFPDGSDNDALGELTDIPVRAFVGGNDTQWIEPAETAINEISRLGGNATLRIFEGEDHIIRSTYDGQVVFQQLERFRPAS